MFILGKLVEIFLLGVIGGAVPGPILTSVFIEILNSNFLYGLKVVFKALFAESCVALIVLLFFDWLRIPQLYFYIISLFGALVLFWLAWQIRNIKTVVKSGDNVITLPKILLLTVLNGGFWIFWITISVPRAFEIKKHLSGGQYIFLLIFEFGWLLVTLTIAYVFSRFRGLLEKKNLVSATYKIFSMLLALFAIKNVYDSLKFIFNQKY